VRVNNVYMLLHHSSKCKRKDRAWARFSALLACSNPDPLPGVLRAVDHHQPKLESAASAHKQNSQSHAANHGRARNAHSAATAPYKPRTTSTAPPSHLHPRRRPLWGPFRKRNLKYVKTWRVAIAADICSVRSLCIPPADFSRCAVASRPRRSHA
jgi:hypothetical protein